MGQAFAAAPAAAAEEAANGAVAMPAAAPETEGSMEAVTAGQEPVALEEGSGEGPSDQPPQEFMAVQTDIAGDDVEAASPADEAASSNEEPAAVVMEETSAAQEEEEEEPASL
jgi:hypothetical protein